MRAGLSLLLLTVLCPCIAPILAQTPICTIQGAGANSLLDGQTVTAEGFVTAIYQGTGALGGFFLEDPFCDTDPATSNGIFVYAPFTTGLQVGQGIRVVGLVDEFNGSTVLTNVSVAFLGTTGTVPATDISLPISSPSVWEQYEGMLLRFPGTLTVTGTQDWARYGEVELAPDRLITPTNAIDPNDAATSGTTTNGTSNVAAIAVAAGENGRSTLTLDDGLTAAYPTTLPLIGPEGTLRGGSTIVDLRGVLTYTFGAYRLEPAGVVNIQHALRPALPAVGGSLRAASLNVLNYWTTLGVWGAANSQELVRQRTKLIAALQALDADVYALHELENNDVAWIALLEALNATGIGTFAGLEQDAFGSGGTKSVIFYRTTSLTPVTELFVLNTGLFQRPHITQGFQVNATGRNFLFSTAHMRSKLCDNATGSNVDQGDGQGCFNAQRRSQAEALAVHWAGVRASAGIDAQLVMGDMNSYTEEDPMDVLRAAGLIRLLDTDEYTYAFQGAFGALDHAWATPSMDQSATDAVVWHLNSDEPEAMDYNDANLARYQANAFRCSDHDPVLVGFDPSLLPVALAEAARAPTVLFVLNGTQAQWTMDAAVEPGAAMALYDARGALVRIIPTSGSSVVHADLQGLSPGVHLWRIMRASGPVAFGRFVIP